MKITKKCPQCGTGFTGRSNQKYCSDRCKVDAFRQAKALNLHQPTTIDSVDEIALEPLTSRPSSPSPPLPPPRPNSASNRDTVALRRLNTAHEQELKKLDMEEAGRCRAHELEMARLKASQESPARQGDPPTKRISQPTSLSPLTEWTHFSLGIRRQYQALINAGLKATEDPFYQAACRKWLVEGYQPFNAAVEAFIAHQKIPIGATKPFVWLADLAQLIQEHGDRNHSVEEEATWRLRIDPYLHQQLLQACL